MPSFKYVIELSEQDRIELIDIVTKGTSSARKILRANILLASDKRSDKYMTVSEIAKPIIPLPQLFRLLGHLTVKMVLQLLSIERNVKHRLFLLK